MEEQAEQFGFAQALRQCSEGLTFGAHAVLKQDSLFDTPPLQQELALHRITGPARKPPTSFVCRVDFCALPTPVCVMQREPRAELPYTRERTLVPTRIHEGQYTQAFTLCKL